MSETRMKLALGEDAPSDLDLGGGMPGDAVASSRHSPDFTKPTRRWSRLFNLAKPISRAKQEASRATLDEQTYRDHDGCRPEDVRNVEDLIGITLIVRITNIFDALE
jgi:hypothetical protein